MAWEVSPSKFQTGNKAGQEQVWTLGSGAVARSSHGQVSPPSWLLSAFWFIIRLPQLEMSNCPAIGAKEITVWLLGEGHYWPSGELEAPSQRARTVPAHLVIVFPVQEKTGQAGTGSSAPSLSGGPEAQVT